MGTSSMYGGPRTGLVPSWADDPVPGGVPSPNPAVAPIAPGQGGEVPAAPAGLSLPAAQPDQAGAGAFSGARTGFTRFARTGSRSALESALSHYVHSGTGGARRAARRMGSSRSAGSRLLGIIRDVERHGAAETLRNLNLPDLAGRPAADVFLVLIEFVCPPGGSIDEAIARQAMLEAICDVAEAGLGDFDALTPVQLEEFFLDFISRSIEGRIVNDIGGRGITLPDDVDAIDNAQRHLHDFVAGCVRSALGDRLDDLDRLSDQDLRRTVDDIYEAAFAVLAAVAERAA
jgi:hypothetical protein